MANGTTQGQEVCYVGSDFQVNIATILLPAGYNLLVLPAISLPSVTTGSLHVDSRLAVASPVTVLAATDHTITVDATAAPIVVNLPALSASLIGTQFTFKRVDATANAITITPAGADTIDGAATMVLVAQYETLALEAMQTAVATFLWGVVSAYGIGPADSGGLGFRMLRKAD